MAVDVLSSGRAGGDPHGSAGTKGPRSIDQVQRLIWNSIFALLAQDPGHARGERTKSQLARPVRVRVRARAEGGRQIYFEGHPEEVGREFHLYLFIVSLSRRVVTGRRLRSYITAGETMGRRLTTGRTVAATATTAAAAGAAAAATTATTMRPRDIISPAADFWPAADFSMRRQVVEQIEAPRGSSSPSPASIQPAS